MRSRYYNVADGRFQSRDTFGGIYTDPFTLNRWAYAHDNPVLLTDPSGNCDIVCVIAILIALGVLTSGCSSSEPVDVCPPLPANLEPDALEKTPRSQALTEIKDYFRIQLPPSVTYNDISHRSHSTSYKFVYSPLKLEFAAGYTPWFTNQFEGRWGSEWGDLMIFETSFTVFEYNAYDIAAVMVHEATHAWEQYTLLQLAQDPQSRFMQNLGNHSYFAWEWGDEYNNVLEYEASSYVLQHTPKPLCISQNRRDVEDDYLDAHKSRKPVIGLEQSPWPMSGYSLP